MKMKNLLFGFLALLLASVLINPNYAAEPIGQWHLDEGKGEEIKDSSKKGSNGALLNGTEWAVGTLGNALKFDGQDDCVSIPANELPKEYTLSAWIYQISADISPGDDQDYGQTILSSSSVSGTNYGFWLLSYKGKQIRFYSFATAPAVVNSLLTDEVISLEKWYHIAVTAIQGGDSVIYVDGMEKARWKNQGGNVTTTAYYIGDLRLDRKITFNGIIDEVAIYNTVLSAGEIAGLGSFAVSYSGKLTTTWGVIKNQ